MTLLYEQTSDSEISSYTTTKSYNSLLIFAGIGGVQSGQPGSYSDFGIPTLSEGKIEQLYSVNKYYTSNVNSGGYSFKLYIATNIPSGTTITAPKKGRMAIFYSV